MRKDNVTNLARIIYDAYPNSDLLPIDPDKDCRSLQDLFTAVTKNNIGDTLFQFIVIEVIEGGECRPGGAIRVLERAREDIDAVLMALCHSGPCLSHQWECPVNGDVAEFLGNGGFFVIGKNTTDPNPELPFEAWGYKGPMDFKTAEPVTFGLGADCGDALCALNAQLASITGKTDPAAHKPAKMAFRIKHRCICRWECPDCNRSIDWSYRRLADAGNPYCPLCKNEMQLVIGTTPVELKRDLTPCQISELIEASHRVVNDWPTGHLAESVRGLDHVLKQLAPTQ
jgi:hypothetical protein